MHFTYTAEELGLFSTINERVWGTQQLLLLFWGCLSEGACVSPQVSRTRIHEWNLHMLLLKVGMWGHFQSSDLFLHLRISVSSEATSPL